MRAFFLAGLLSIAIVFSCSLVLVWEVPVKENDVRRFYPTSFVVGLVLLVFLVTGILALVERKTRRPIPLGWYVMATILHITFWTELPVIMTHKFIISWHRPGLAATSNLDSLRPIR
ncbi:MAG: hypothetical protein V4599_01175 [Verrucomicrobiota bacterium]